MTLEKAPGIHRAVWNLQAQPPAPPATGGEGAAQGRGAGAAGGRGAGGAGGAPGGGRGGRGGGGNAVDPGTYRVAIGKLVNGTFTQVGPAQTFQVIPLPDKNYQSYR